MLDKPAPPLPTRQWLTLDESAAWLGVSRRQLDFLVKAGKISPSYTLGKQLPRCSVAHLDDVMEARHGISGEA